MDARIGIDFGGVIVRNLHEDTGEDTSLQSSSGSEAARDGAFDAIHQSFHRRPRAHYANPSRRCSAFVSVRRARGREVLSALGDLRKKLATGAGLCELLPTTQNPALTSRGVPE